jgi:transcriptional regulator GlxA family with amidase domain
VVFVVFPEFQLLDAAGPISAFEIAGAFAGNAYRLEVRAERRGLVRSSSGAAFDARALGSTRGVHTVVVAGGNGTRDAASSPELQRWLCRLAKTRVRIASVCSGSFVLAAAGLLDGKAATTHWSRTRDFRERFPEVALEPDRIYVKAGRVWSSAGISAGIDLALAMIEEDLGEAIARRTAQQLVVYHRRPGGQTQFSALLELEHPSGQFGTLLDAVRSNLRAAWTVSALARQVGMSPRNFARKFRAATEATPARAVERLRTEAARALLDGGASSVQDVARQTGFADPERMRRAFHRLYGAAPRVLCRPSMPRG